MTSPRTATSRKTTPRKAASSVPDNVRQPSDHLPGADAAAQKAEALGELRTVVVDEVTYTLDPEVLDDVDVFEALQQNNVIPALTALLTPGEYAAARKALADPATGRTKYSTLVAFCNELMTGLGAGN